METLTTDKTIYKVGQPIHITLTETNTTNATIVSPSVTGLDEFHREPELQGRLEVEGGKAGRASFTLQPGQTHTITVTWNGHANVGSRSRSDTADRHVPDR